MVGFYARADSSKPIRTDLDNELLGQYYGSRPREMGVVVEYPSLDARWFTREEILAILSHKSGTRFDKADYKKSGENTEGRSNIEKGSSDPALQASTPIDTATTPQPILAERRSSLNELPFHIPPVNSIAGVLIRDWAEKKIGFPLEDTIRGNL